MFFRTGPTRCDAIALYAEHAERTLGEPIATDLLAAIDNQTRPRLWRQGGVKSLAVCLNSVRANPAITFVQRRLATLGPAQDESFLLVRLIRERKFALIRGSLERLLKSFE